MRYGSFSYGQVSDDTPPATFQQNATTNSGNLGTTMANLVPPKAKEALLSAGINFLTDTIKAVLISDQYVYNAAHANLSDFAAYVVGAAVTLTGKTIVGGLVDFADVVFTSVASGSTVVAIHLYKDTGTASASPFLLHIDNATNLPAATNGQNITYSTPAGGVQF